MAMLKIVKNKVFLFIATRYLSYFIQFLNSLIVAFVLGPYYLGIWGFLSMILQYLAFGNFGIENALNVTLSTGNTFDDAKKQSQIISNALVATTLASLILLIPVLVINLSGIHLFEKYLFSNYIFFIAIIACLNYFNLLFVNLFRTYSLFTPISVFQLIIQVLQLPMYFLLEDTKLISGLLSMILLGHVISFFLFIKKMPIKIDWTIDIQIIKNLYKRGLSLLFYNVTFYFLMLSTRSLIGYFYPVETMGLFTFASNIAAALIVGLSSLEFVVFPKMLNRLSANEVNGESMTVFNEVRYIYMATVYLIIILGLIFYPVLLLFFEKYSATVNVFSFLVLCQIVLSSGFGYSTLIIARGKELFLVFHGVVALLLNVVLSILAYSFFEFDYSFMTVFLILAFIYYDIQVIRKGRELLQRKVSLAEVMNDLFPLKSVPSLIFVIASIVTERYQLFYALAFLSFIVFNFNGFGLIKRYVLNIIHQPSIVNIRKE